MGRQYRSPRLFGALAAERLLAKALGGENHPAPRYEREKRKYHPTASRMTSGSNCRHLNKPQTEEARRSIRPVYHGLPVKLQHCQNGCGKGKNGELTAEDIIVKLSKRNLEHSVRR